MAKTQRYFDPKLGAVGAIFMGGIVYYINREHGLDSAMVAAAKQGAYTLLVGGVMAKMCENISTSRKLPVPVAVSSSIVIPSVITAGLTYAVHKLKGTPEPFNSTLPTIFLSPLGFILWGSASRYCQNINDNKSVYGRMNRSASSLENKIDVGGANEH
jgi:hypothetical protein